VLAFWGNHAKSFASNFPPKKLTHRCTRAFKVCMLDNMAIDHNGGSTSIEDEGVEVYAMIPQKNKRGSQRGHVDHKNLKTFLTLSCSLRDVRILGMTMF